MRYNRTSVKGQIDKLGRNEVVVDGTNTKYWLASEEKREEQ